MAEDSKVWGFLGFFLLIIGFLIVYLTKKDDAYAMYYAKQGLVFNIAFVVIWIAGFVLAFVPVIGWLLYMVLLIAMLVLFIIGIIFSLSGKQKPVPIIGQLADKIKL